MWSSKRVKQNSKEIWIEKIILGKDKKRIKKEKNYLKEA